MRTAAATDLAPTRPRLVATDLDGTLLRSDGTLSPYTRATLMELDRRGVPVVFATGRPLRWMASLWRDVGRLGLAICSNGGILYDVARRSLRSARTIEPEVARQVAAALRGRLPGTVFALERTGGFAREDGYPSPEGAAVEAAVGPLEGLLDSSVVKMLARHHALAPEAFRRQVEASVGGLVTTTWSVHGSLVEMSARGVTKASTLATLCAELGVAARDVIAFGDMPNDIPLLRWAGRPYAMANAHPSVQAAAAHRAPANDDDGVASVLASLFDL